MLTNDAKNYILVESTFSRYCCLVIEHKIGGIIYTNAMSQTAVEQKNR